MNEYISKINKFEFPTSIISGYIESFMSLSKSIINRVVNEWIYMNDLNDWENKFEFSVNN